MCGVLGLVDEGTRDDLGKIAAELLRAEAGLEPGLALEMSLLEQHYLEGLGLGRARPRGVASKRRVALAPRLGRGSAVKRLTIEHG
jgi:hypothetical protein